MPPVQQSGATTREPTEIRSAWKKNPITTKLTLESKLFWIINMMHAAAKKVQNMRWHSPPDTHSMMFPYLGWTWLDSCARNTRASRSWSATSDTCRCGRNPQAPSRIPAPAPRVFQEESISAHFATPAGTTTETTPSKTAAPRTTKAANYPDFLGRKRHDALGGVRNTRVSRCDGRWEWIWDALSELRKWSSKHGHQPVRSLGKGGDASP